MKVKKLTEKRTVEHRVFIFAALHIAGNMAGITLSEWSKLFCGKLMSVLMKHFSTLAVVQRSTDFLAVM